MSSLDDVLEQRSEYRQMNPWEENGILHSLTPDQRQLYLEMDNLVRRYRHAKGTSTMFFGMSLIETGFTLFFGYFCYRGFSEDIPAVGIMAAGATLPLGLMTYKFVKETVDSRRRKKNLKKKILDLSEDYLNLPHTIS